MLNIFNYLFTRFSTGLLKFIAAGIIIFKTTYKIKWASYILHKSTSYDNRPSAFYVHDAIKVNCTQNLLNLIQIYLLKSKKTSIAYM